MRLVCFFPGDADLGYELGSRPGAAGRAIIRADGCPRVVQLPANAACFRRVRERFAELDDGDGKGERVPAGSPSQITRSTIAVQQ